MQEGRRPRSVLTVIDATYDARKRVYGSEEPYTHNTLWGEILPSDHTRETSMKMIRITRHWGCTDSDTKLGCDSGGWFKMELLVRDLVARHPPKWARSLRRSLGEQAAARYDEQMHVGWERLIVQSLPVNHPKQKIRYQYLLESREDEDGSMSFLRVSAIRAASGHSEWSIMDPLRTATKVQQ